MKHEKIHTEFGILLRLEKDSFLSNSPTWKINRKSL